MTGSAMKCNGMEMDVVFALLLGEKVKKGRESEGGRVKNWPGAEGFGFI